MIFRFAAGRLRLTFLICVAVLAFAPGCTTVSPPPYTTGEREHLLTDLCEENGIQWRWDSVSQIINLSYGFNEANVRVGSDLAVINGSKVQMKAPVRVVRSTIIVSDEFKEKVIDVLTSEDAPALRPYRAPRVRRIVIDAGHGGKDPGAIGRSGVYEKDVVLDIARHIRPVLEEKGFDVLMTRDDDTFISLKERTEIASESNADLFVSIHANANHVRSINGFEVYVGKHMNYLEKNEEQRLTNHDLYFQNLSMRENDPHLKDILEDMLYIHKVVESETLAEELTRKIPDALRVKNLGKKYARFYVLRNTLVPAVLVEVGFLSNPKEERLLTDAGYRRSVAEELAQNLVDYAHGR